MTEICGMTPEASTLRLEHLAIAAEGRDALLDTGAAGVEEADDRRAVLQRHVLDLGHLLGMRFGQRAAEHGEILGEDEDRPAVDRAPAGDDAVAGDPRLLHAEIGGAVLHEHVELLEGALVEQDLEPLARGQLRFRMLRGDALLAAAEPRRGPPDLELLKDMLHRLALPACRLQPSYSASGCR